MDIAQFRLDFPEFSSTTIYTNSQITFWATIAEMQLVESIWTDLKPFAVELYVAHEITIAAQNQKAAAAGGVPGTSGGIANSKTVGSVSVGYDSQVTSFKQADAAFWNLTTYGKQLYNLILMFGAGCIQL